MPLTDDRGLDSDTTHRVTGPFARCRLALPIPVLRGPRQTNLLPHFRTRSWLTDHITNHSAARPASQDRITTSQWRLDASLQLPLQKGQKIGTSLDVGTETRPSEDESPVRHHLSDRNSYHGSNNATLVEQSRQPVYHEEWPWLSSTSDLRDPNPLSSPPRPRPSLFAAVDGTTSDVLRRPSSSDRKSKSENGVGVDTGRAKDTRQVTTSVITVQSLIDRADGVQRLRSGRTKHTPPLSTAIAPAVSAEAVTVAAAEVQLTLLLDGTSTGSLDRSDRPSSGVNIAQSSVELDPSPAQSGSPYSLHHRLSRLAERLSHQPKTSCPLAYSPPDSIVQNLELHHARLLPSFEAEQLSSEDRPTRRLSETYPDTRSPESDDEGSPPRSPRSAVWSVDEMDETPMTSPSRSPTKERPGLCHFSTLVKNIPQMDGEAGDVTDEERGDGVLQTSPVTGESWEEGIARSSQQTTESDNDVFHSSYSVQPLNDRFAPLVTPSFTKEPHAFPFPRNSISGRTLARHPSTLLHQYERNVTPRQRRLMNGGAQAPNRFIPSRAGTPTKQSLHLTKQRSTSTRSVPDTPESDPFGPVPARSLRMADRYAATRNPIIPMRAIGVATRAEGPHAPPLRAASAGTIWTVGGMLVTEGIASVSNGRGGRVTSGTNAPHYAADFLRKNSPSEDEVTHSRRLAIAMDVDRAARMLVHRSPALISSSPKDGGSRSPKVRIWKDGTWQQEGGDTRAWLQAKCRPKKTKDVPVIPFRVLDASALRDDYYCSLLSYSPTIQCLAVGLGPHVYLWSEKRGPTGMPDSLTAPAGSSHVTSVSFSSVGGGSAILALGRADGRITLWSPLDRDPRFDSDQPSPISCLSFRPTTVRRPSLRDTNIMVATEELLVGDDIGFVYFYSVEWPNQEQRDLFDWHGSMTLLVRIECHSQQVCGLAWSSDGHYFGTGGNDNQLFLFESKKVLLHSASKMANRSTVRVRAGGSNSSNATVTGQGDVVTITPGIERHVFPLNAAVKAIAFAPWQPTLLAAGGGSNDRCIHFFHTLSGSPLATIDCHAQVTSLVWSEKRKEIASTFGFAQPEHPYRVAVFAWPSCNMVVRIPWWGEERALFAVAYPRGPTTGQQLQGASSTAAHRTDAEGRPWYGKRTREEGCLVVATSDASIKFHEIWAEKSSEGGKRVSSGVFGGSQILEEEYTGDVERWGQVIR